MLLKYPILDLIKKVLRGFYPANGTISTRGAATAALIAGGGTSTTPVTTSTAGGNFFGFWTKTTDATGADSRGIYFRHYLGGAGASGEAGRYFTTVDAAGAVGVHGVHCSLSFGTSGNVTGEGAAIRGTLQIPNKAITGTTAAIYGELWSDGASSDINGTCGLLRLVNAGNATGMGKVDDSGYVMVIEGLTAGAAHAFRTGLVAATVNAATTAALRINVGGTTYYIPLATATA